MVRSILIEALIDKGEHFSQHSGMFLHDKRPKMAIIHMDASKGVSVCRYSNLWR